MSAIEDEIQDLNERVRRLELLRDHAGQGLRADELQELRSQAARDGNKRLLRALNSRQTADPHFERAVLVEE